MMVLSTAMRDKAAALWPSLQVAKILDVGAIEDREIVAVCAFMLSAQRLPLPRISCMCGVARGCRRPRAIARS